MWPYIIMMVASMVISYALRPKPPEMQAATLDEFTAPTAEEGKSIPVLFGTRDVQAPNVVWYGDMAARAIKKKGGKK